MANLLIKEVYKRYDKRGQDVVRGVNLEIKEKSFVVVVGPSGCGKSTILRMIAGLEKVDAGEIFIDNTLVNNLEPKDRNIAMVFQNYALYPHMNVFKNIAYSLKISGVPREEIRKRVEETADILKIRPFLDRKPNQLSGGQRQRVAMGRALIRKPKIFLFDEPLSNLDAKLRVQTRVEIKKLQRKLGITSVFVTHDQIEAMTLADTLVVMNQGIFEQIGTPLEVYEKPATQFVAKFIGSPAMNLVSGRLIDQKTIRLSNDFLLKLEKSFIKQDYLNKKITIGIRAEHFEWCPGSKADLFLKVDLIEELGGEKIFCGQLYNPSNQKVLQDNDKEKNLQTTYISFPNRKIKENRLQEKVTVDSILSLKIADSQICFFDPETEKRIADY